MFLQRRSDERVRCAQAAGQRRDEDAQRLVIELIMCNELAGLFYNGVVALSVNGTCCIRRRGEKKDVSKTSQLPTNDSKPDRVLLLSCDIRVRNHDMTQDLFSGFIFAALRQDKAVLQ